MSNAASLSVVIPEYRGTHLASVIEAVRALAPIEIIVVDSSPGGPSFSAEDVTVVTSPRRLLAGEARNVGAQRARGDVLLFLDSDVILKNAGLEFVREFLAQPSGIAWGIYDVERRDEGFLAFLKNHILLYRHLSDTGGIGWGSSSHFLIEREVDLKIGGFNPDLKSYEDVEFFTRCGKLGHPVRMESRFEAEHLKRFSAVGFLVEHFDRACRAFLIRRRFPALFAGVSVRVRPAMALTWLASGAIPVILAAGGVFLIPPWLALTLAFICLISPVSLVPTVFARMSWADRLAAMGAWHLVGIGTVAGVASGVALWAATSVKLRLRILLDLTRALKRVLIRSAGLPVQIIHYVTARCNLRCEHCFYKETLDAPDPGEISLQRLEKTTKEIGPILWYSLGGGEPILRKDLVEVAEIIHNNCRPRVFSFPSNGWYVERTFDLMLRMLQKLPDQTIIIFISLDGPKDIHDKIRGDGSFDKARETMERLRPLQALYPNLYLNVVTTVMPTNAHVASAFIDQVVDDFRPNAISINLFRYHALEHPPVPDFVIDAYKSAVERYAECLNSGRLAHYNLFASRVLRAKEILQKELIYRVSKFDEFVTPCLGGTLSYVIMEDNRLKPCEILSDDLGKVGTDAPQATFSGLVSSRQAKDLRGWIRKSECKCTYECAMSTNVLFSWPMTGRLVKEVAGQFLDTAARDRRLPETLQPTEK